VARGEYIRKLDVEEVLSIHDSLVRDFSLTSDPIEPPGVKDIGLLESAIGRQYTGHGTQIKYDSPSSSAATLCYGVCCNHAFHNGNKRTALVAMLCHIDRNGLTLQRGVSQRDLYELMIRIADHKLVRKSSRRFDSDQEVGELSEWVRKNTRKLDKSERVVTFRELRRVLKSFSVELENPKGNYIDVVRYEEKRGLLGIGKRVVRTRVTHIPYPGEGHEVGKSLVKNIRKYCGLTERDGYDSEMFYGGDRDPDFFIMKYKKTIQRLAKV